MKKKIFISGATREFDSTDSRPFCEGIEDYIKANQLPIDCPINFNVTAKLTGTQEVTIKIPLSTGDDIVPNTISRQLYRLFTGECETFIAEHSAWCTIGFGPSYPMNVRIGIDDIKDCHKLNTKFYKANRYKNLDIVETEIGLEIKIQY